MSGAGTGDGALDGPGTVLQEPRDVEAALDPDAGRGTLRDLLTSVFHDRWRIGLVLVIGLALTLLAVALAPRTYTAEAELLLRLGREYIYKPELGASPGNAPVAYDREETVLAESRILTSRDLMDTVLDKFGDTAVFPQLQGSAPRRWLHQTALPALHLAWLWPAAANDDSARLRRRAAAIMAFERALKADLLKGSNLLQVSFEARDPQVAAAVLAEVVQVYLQRRTVIFASGMREAAQASFDARKARLLQADARLAALKRSRGIQAFGAEQSLLLNQRNGLEERRAESQVALARASARADSLRASLKTVSGDVQLSSETQRSEAVEKARSLLLDLKLKERDLSSQFTDDSPAVQDVRADMARTADYLRELLQNPVRAVRTGRSPARDAVESDLLRTLADQQQARSEAQTLLAERQAMDQRLTALSASETELMALERDRRLAESDYDAAARALRDELTLAELDREQRTNVSVVQPPRTPVNGKSLAAVLALVGLFLSLFAALLTAFLSALWRDTFLTPEQVERGLGLPMLAAVPRSGT